MKILVTGAAGQLGRAMRRCLEREIPGATVYATHSDLDITDREAVNRFVADGRFTHIVNCAAFIDVDASESNPRQAKAVNTDGVGNLATAAHNAEARIIHISTDYVFDGEHNRPYTESDKVNPLGEYGRSKRRGEMMLLDFAPDGIVIRTAWIFSPEGKNFVTGMCEAARQRRPIKMISDKISTPTSADELAEAIVTIIKSPRWIGGIFHYSGQGSASRYDMAAEIYDLCGAPSELVSPARTDEFAGPARRPAYSIMDKSRIGNAYGIHPRYWRTSLRECVETIQRQHNQPTDKN